LLARSRLCCLAYAAALAHKSMTAWLQRCLLLLLIGTCVGQWKAPKRGSAQRVQIASSQGSQRDAHPGAQFAGLDSSEEDVQVAAADGYQSFDDRLSDPVVAGGAETEDEARHAYAIEFIEPLDGGTISSTPFRVSMRTTGGFSVPEHGEIRLVMAYPGRGEDVRVLQSTQFHSWNVVGGDFTITAILISTKDEVMSNSTTVHVRQEPGPHFVLSQPLDGQLLLARNDVPVVMQFGGAVPEGSRVCFDVKSSPPIGSTKSPPQQIRKCTDDDGIAIKEESGGLRVQIPVSAGNCSLRAAVYDAEGRRLTPETVRHFRVVEEQQECPPGSGVACLHGECQGSRCVCDFGDFGGRRCAPSASRFRV
jgi:hypothetical protein